MTCLREDGSSTWMCSNEFFVQHDLGHYAIETMFGSDEAFFGLIAKGWDISAFEERAPNSKKCRAVPPEAIHAEVLAGLLDLRRANPHLTASELVEVLSALDSPEGHLRTNFDQEKLEAVLVSHEALLGRWRALSPGQDLELEFPPATA